MEGGTIAGVDISGCCMMEGGLGVMARVLGSVLVVVLAAWMAARRGGRRRRRPPGPRGLPVVGHMLLLRERSFRTLARLAADKRRGGPVMGLRLGSLEAVVASSPGAAREFLQGHDRRFADRLQTEASRRLFYGPPARACLAMHYGPECVALRRAYTAHLLGPACLPALRHLRLQELLSGLRRLTPSPATPVSIHQLAYRISSNAICRMLAGTTLDDPDNDAFLASLPELNKAFTTPYLGKFFPLPTWLDLGGQKARMNAINKCLDVFIEKLITKHTLKKSIESTNMGSPFASDLLDFLLSTNYDLKIVKASILELLNGGVEPISSVTEWAMAELIYHPQVMKKVQAEVDKVVEGGKKYVIEEIDFPKLAYTQAVVQETLRLHPPIPMVVRQATPELRPCKVMGYDIEPKTLLMVNVWGIGRDPSVWDNAHEFWPDRFIEGTISSVAHMNMKGQCFELIPFGSGRRMCPAMNLAIAMVTLMIANFTLLFQWEKVSNYKSKDSLIEVKDDATTNALENSIGLIASMSKKLHLIPTPRKPMPSF